MCARAHPLNLAGVVSQAGGEGSGRIPLLVVPADLLTQHGLERDGAKPGRQVLSGDGKTSSLWKDGETRLSVPVYQVRLDRLSLPCIDLIQPSHLSCLDSSVG